MIPKEMIKAFSNAWDRYNERPGRLTHEERIEFALTAALSAAETQGYKLVKFVKRERQPFVFEDEEPLPPSPPEEKAE